MKHTSGPWKVDKGKAMKPWSKEIVNDTGDIVICGTNAVDARLIAAAPEMLEALKWAMRHVDNVFALASFSDSERQDYERAKAAIAKAEGR